MTVTADIKKLERHYIPSDFAITDWNTLEPYFKELVERPINSREDLEKWLKDMSEVEAVVSEDACWRQIKMTCDTTDKSLEESFNFFFMEIQPKIQPYADRLNRKLIDNPFTKELDQQQYFTYLRNVKKALTYFAKQIFPCRQS
ncbi:MAG: hypothetical protein WKG06_37835 [Segetibacter sp.]